ncbi:SWIM zinc finger family protein [Haloplanus natans]|uniref:SWIM zinc finger family protein n=1 Tax=Haloplanus natans TaxID=376171 RepID=UPI000677F43A|nr:SWIM zinc finger family protein [Haloplanus natans]
MATNESGKEKTAVEYLNFGAKTAKRVTWEAWSFRLVGPLQVLVTNESYGVEKDAHAYVVAVEDVGGTIVPRECECPADRFRDDYACKHRAALATVAGPVVMNAAAEFPEKSLEGPDSVDPTPVTDGGHREDQNCDCESLGDLPCWPCYQSERNK